MTLLDGFEHLDHARSYGGSYVDGVPWRLVFHTTEAVPSTVAGARSMALRHPYPPHLWVWPEKGWKAQTVLLSRSAFALLHPRGTPETNKMRPLQVEVIGYAKDSPHKPDWWWEWLGTEVTRPIIDAGYPINLDNIAPLTGSDGYGHNGTVRMSRSRWRHFDGICSHSNVPDNAHWDIGDGRLDLIAAAAKPTPIVTPPPAQEDDLMSLTVDGRQLVTDTYEAAGRKTTDAGGRAYWTAMLACTEKPDERRQVINSLRDQLGLQSI